MSIVGGWGSESVCDTPTGKSCFVFLFALRACVRDATRDQGVSRRVFVPAPAAPAAAPAPPGPSLRKEEIISRVFEI